MLQTEVLTGLLIYLDKKSHLNLCGIICNNRKEKIYFQEIANVNNFRIYLFYQLLISTIELFTLQFPIGHKETLSQINMSNYLSFVK